VDEDDFEKETRCCFSFFHFPWMQKLANIKVYALVYGLYGFIEFALSSYFIGILSTMEKRFEISSTFSGTPLKYQNFQIENFKDKTRKLFTSSKLAFIYPLQA
jgi:hypothetical protein